MESVEFENSEEYCSYCGSEDVYRHACRLMCRDCGGTCEGCSE